MSYEIRDMSIIIDGRALAEKIKDGIVKEITTGRKGPFICTCLRPNLAIILIGNREDSELYVSLKEKEAKKVGIDTHLYRCAESISEREVLEIIDYLNKDDLIDAILVQLPLPAGLNTDKIIAAIDPAKDVDRFHPENLKNLFATCEHLGFMPPVFEAVLEILKSIDYDLEKKKVCILANSKIFGRSLAKVLTCQGALVSLAGAGDKNLKAKSQEADVLITAIGKPKFIKKEMVKKDAVVIDIGVTRIGALTGLGRTKVSGDVDFEDVKSVAGYLTPVPGGVGPLTIAMAFKNTLALHKSRAICYNK